MKKNITHTVILLLSFLIVNENSAQDVSNTSNVAEDKNKLFEHDFQLGADIMPFVRTTGFADEVGTVNPSNRVAELREYDGGLYLRPSLKYSLSKENELLTLWVKPRLNFDADLDAEDDDFFDNDNFEADFFFQELKAKFNVNKNLYFIGGRYLKEIGSSSIFINPSNPFLPNPGRLNPKLEVRPMDFVEMNFSTKTAWEFSLIANLYQAQNPDYQEPFLRFDRTYGILGEYYGDAMNIGLISSIDEGQKIQLGGFAQSNINEALLVYGDFSVVHNPKRYYPVEGHWTDPALLEYDMENGNDNEKVFASGLVGATYTLDIGPTISLEYFYNGIGFNKEQYELLNASIVSSSNYNFEVTNDLANLNLARAINPGMTYLRRHYIFAQIGDVDLFERLNYNVRVVFSAEDQSTQLSSLLEYNLDAFEFYAVLLSNLGGRDTDLNKLVDYSVMLGAIYRL